MPVIACPHCGTKLDGPDSVLGKEVICGQCQQRFIAAGEAPFGSQYASPEPPQALREGGFASMESLTPPPAGMDEPANAPQAPPRAPLEPPPQPAPVAPQPPRPAGVPQPPPTGQQYGPPPMPGQPYGPFMPYSSLPPASGATASLVLGIISIVGSCCCWGVVGLICGSLAVVFGNKAMRAINAGQAAPTDRGKAAAGRICGIVGLILSILVIIIAIISFATNGMHGRFNTYRF